MTDIKVARTKKIQPSDFKVGETRDAVVLGYDRTARHTLAWEITSGNLLVPGYGVRHTEWAVAAIVRHAREYDLPLYGIDFSSLLGEFAAKTFTTRTTTRDGAETLLEQLASATTEGILVITNGGQLLAPAHTALDVEVQAAANERVHQALLAVLANEYIHVVFVTARLHEATALPEDVIAACRATLVVGKIMTRDAERIIDERAFKLTQEMTMMHSVLINPDGKPVELEHFRVPVK